MKAYRTHEIADHSSRRTGTPRHDGAVFLHCKAVKTFWTVTSKTRQERRAPNRAIAVTWHKEIQTGQNRRRSISMAQRHIARGAVGPGERGRAERTVTTLAVNCQQTQIKRQNKAKANREQFVVNESDTRNSPEMRQEAEPHAPHSRRVDKARHARAIEKRDVAQPPVLPLLPLDKAQHLHPTASPDALQTNCAWEKDNCD